jgi:hypothetical protein
MDPLDTPSCQGRPTDGFMLENIDPDSICMYGYLGIVANIGHGVRRED